MFLNNDELVRLTGREQHAAQKRYLNRKKIPFEENVVWVTAPRVRISPSPPMTRIPLIADTNKNSKRVTLCNVGV